jgi:hypothetical protein
VPKRVKSRSMIWNSIPLMTAFDLLIIAVAIYAIWRWRLIGPSKRPSAPQIGLRLIVLGLVGICLFYFVDLLSMYVSPAVMSRQAAMAFMDALHQNVSWFAVLFAMIAISSGFIELRRTQIELAEKNELLADLSSKLAKFLPAQLYNSIFTGTQSARVVAKRKKLTIFFSDIANFTETTDSLESEELTNLLNQYLTEMSKIAISHGATIDKYVGDAIMAFFAIRRAAGARRTPSLASRWRSPCSGGCASCSSNGWISAQKSHSSCASGSTRASAPSAISVARTGWTTPLLATR